MTDTKPVTKSSWIHRVKEVFTTDLRSFALTRILTGFALIYDTIYRATELTAHYTDDGIVSAELARQIVAEYGWFSIHTWSGEFWYQALLSAILGLLAFSVMVGYKTRIVTPLAWFLFVSVQNRFFFGDYPGDYILTMLLLCGIFLPWNAYFSVDAKLALKGTQGLPPASYRGFGSYLFLIVFSVFIAKTGLSKIAAGASWLDGTAIYYVLQSVRYTSRGFDWMLEYPALLTLGSYIVPYLELLLPVLFFFPFKNGIVRTSAVFVICLLFASFGMGLDLHLLPFLAGVAYVGFLPPDFWNRFLPAAVSRTWLAPQFTKHLKCTMGLCRDQDLLPGKVRHFHNWIGMVVLALICVHYYFKVGNFGFFSTPREPAAVMARPIEFLKLKNIFRMFSDPKVFSESDGWDVAPGRLADGSTVNVFTGDDLTYEQPDDLIASIGGFRWRQYLTLVNWYPTWNPKNISTYSVVDYPKLRLALAGYMCRTWNETHSDDKRLESLNFEIVVSPIRYLAPKEKPRVIQLSEVDYDCSEIVVSAN